MRIYLVRFQFQSQLAPRSCFQFFMTSWLMILILMTWLCTCQINVFTSCPGLFFFRIANATDVKQSRPVNLAHWALIIAIHSAKRGRTKKELTRKGWPTDYFWTVQEYKCAEFLSIQFRALSRKDRNLKCTFRLNLSNPSQWKSNSSPSWLYSSSRWSRWRSPRKRLMSSQVSEHQVDDFCPSSIWPVWFAFKFTVHCFLKPETGPCRALIPMNFYDPATKSCSKTFMYGGCGGNGNTFDTERLCQLECEPTMPEETH